MTVQRDNVRHFSSAPTYLITALLLSQEATQQYSLDWINPVSDLILSDKM
jgi:hypothetical protein